MEVWVAKQVELPRSEEPLAYGVVSKFELGQCCHMRRDDRPIGGLVHRAFHTATGDAKSWRRTASGDARSSVVPRIRMEGRQPAWAVLDSTPNSKLPFEFTSARLPMPFG